MDIVSAFAPPRLCRLAGVEYWVDRFRLADFALLIGWLDDVLPGRPERKLPPRLGSDEAAAALDSATGKAVHVYLALRGRGVAWEDCRAIAAALDEVEWVRLRDVQYGRRRMRDDAPGGRGSDLAEIWWGPGVAALVVEKGLAYEAIGRFTLDQWEALDPERPGLPDDDPRRLTVAQVEAMRLEALARLKDRQAEAATTTNAGGEGKADE